MGQTRVDLLHLLEDLRDAYPGALEETILSEMVANALDSGATRVSVRADPGEALLVVMDDGRGMRRRELARYHDIAASTKVRGQGIGFAGVGIKLGLLASEEVLTETRRDEGHVATRWRLQGRHKAPWNWVDPPGLVDERGTAVCLSCATRCRRCWMRDGWRPRCTATSRPSSIRGSTSCSPTCIRRLRSSA
jgi:hypothetical protein